MVYHMKLLFHNTIWQFILPLVFLLQVMVFAQISDLPSANAQVDEEFLTFESKENGVVIQYPNDWEVATEIRGVIVAFFSPLENEDDQFSESLTVGSQVVLDNVTLDISVNNTINYFKQFSDFNLIDSQPTTLAQNPAWKIVYQLSSQERDVKTIKVFTIKDHVGYSITFGAESENFAKYLPIVEKMIQSFMITEIELPSPQESPSTDYRIPSWFQNNAGWWGEETITDDEFFNGIGYLIKQNIMIIPEPEPETLDFISQGTLNAAKGNTLRWSLGTITDENFVVLVQYFIENDFVKG